MNYKLALIGFGNVGTGLVDILHRKNEFLRNIENINVTVVAICDKKKGSIYQPSGLDLAKVLELLQNNQPLTLYPDSDYGLSVEETITQTNANVIVELTYTDLRTGEPALTHVRTALEHARHVITSNKGPSVLCHKQLIKLAASHGVFYGIEGTVMSGTPVLRTARESLAGCHIKRIRGILNGTTNYILTQMENGRDYQDVLQQAIDIGYAEADPSGDVDGWDAAAKVVILANVLMNGNIMISDVQRQGITHITQEAIRSANDSGKRWKLIGEITFENGEIRANVSPQLVPFSDPLAHIMGSTNAITFETDMLGPVTVIGAGAGRTETGYAILSDLIALNRTVK